MIPGATHVASLWYWFPRFNIWISWNVLQAFYPLLTKEPINLCYPADKNIAQSIQCKATVKIFRFTQFLALMKESLGLEFSNLKWFRNVQYFYLENISFKQLIEDISQKRYIFSYSTRFSIQYFHTKFTIFDVFTSTYDIGISVDTWNSSKVVPETI